MKTNRKLLFSMLITIVFIVFVGCSKDANSSLTKLKLSVASVPHGEILEYIEDDLKEAGLEVELFIVNDGIQANTQTNNGEFDANFFQHIPYMTQSNEDQGFELVNIASVHVEPFGVYSNTIDSIEALPNNAKISIPKDPVNYSRALELLAENDIIELTNEKKENFTVQDIIENEKNIEFITVDAEMLFHTLEDVDASTINVNYALEGGLKPLEDALVLEGSASNYVNILVAHADKEDDPDIRKLAEILTSDKVKKFIEESYDGAVIPVF